MVCHFSNAMIREHLPLDKRKLYVFLRKLLRMPTKGGGYGDIAPWDTSIINDFKQRADVDLYVISAHSGLKHKVVAFEEEGVHYWFVKCDDATMLKNLMKNDERWVKLNPMIPRVRGIVEKIHPDIVMLVGAENAYYSSTLLGLNGYPTLTLCQTIYNNPERSIYGSVDSKNALVERKLISKEQCFAVYCKKHYDLLRQLAPEKLIFKFGFPSKGVLLSPTPCEKEYDFVNFAMGMSEKKGFHDAIHALTKVKEKYPEVKLNLTGGCTQEMRNELEQLAKSVGVENNVIFTPFFEKQSDLFLHIQKSRFAVLPCKMDNVSGTMTQAMQLGLPIVVYKTTGTPAFNREKKCALIAEHSNVDDLAAKMLYMMDHPDEAETIAKNAREYQEKKAAIEKGNGDRLVAILKAIVDNYKNGTSIPQEMLFDPERDD